ncbi:unnamed protein product [Microthlaspi erraticum]|uniref:F-box domain-containing protein n=1 Tax=Microthlaspi erraticum TaxID=1685480 RepID=A0A6D2IG75_9BRAS|nr:unnamed protein product [Microthlaspi erraticum]
MKRAEEESDPVPNDLLFEIFSRLPSKSIGRFHCVSKRWGSLLRCPDFTQLFLTRSQARPRLLFLLEENNYQWNMYSSLQLQNPYEKSSLVVSADFHTKIHGYTYKHLCGYASGLVFFPNMWLSNRYYDVVCNPMTGQYSILPEVEKYNGNCWESNSRWMSKNGFPRYNTCWSEGICINGVLYYLASGSTVCLDVRSEKCKIIIDTKWIRRPYATTLINYKSKLGGISWEYGKDDIGRRILELSMWVLEDVDEHEWSKYVYTLCDDKIVDEEVFVVGVTARGDIVLSMKRRTTCKRFYVFYFNPESNALQSVEIQGFGELLGNMKIFVDHVDDILTMDIIKTSAITEA